MLTTEPIDCLEAVFKVARLYAYRWRVEEFHKFWKSEGTRVERLRMATPDNLRRVGVLMAFAACRLMRLRDALVAPVNRLDLAPPCEPDPQAVTPAVTKNANLPCSRVLTAIQYLTLWALTTTLPFPGEMPSCRWASIAVARLGGWADTKRTGRPGYRAYSQGWNRLMEACEAIEAVTRVSAFPTLQVSKM